MLLRLEMVTVPIANIDRAKAFYVDQLGFSTEQDLQIDDDHRFGRTRAARVDLHDRPHIGVHRRRTRFAARSSLNVEDVDAVHAHLREREVQITDVQVFPWGRFCFFSDPDGNGWSIHEVSPS